VHPSVLRFVQGQAQLHDLASRSVLEVGSFNVNGSVRRFFTGPYVGIDMQAGPGVDIVMNAHELNTLRVDTLDGHVINSTFDVIVCTEMLEHDDAPWLSLREMAAVCRDDGYLLLTCRGYDWRGCFPVHGYPMDLWRFSCDGVRALLQQTGWRPVFVEPDPEAPGVFAVALLASAGGS
jgi:SAM-dependent methyltransferase